MKYYLPARPALAVLGGLLVLGSSGLARASAELDRRYSIETVGFLKSWDNVDGLFSEYVARAYREYFAHQSRFLVQDLGKADAILSHAKIPYAKLIDDPEVLLQLSRSARSQSILRT